MIRPLEPGDRAGWQRLYEGYQAFYGHADRPAAFYDKAFARLMARDGHDFHGLVHEADGQLLGLTHYVFHPTLWRDEGVCSVQDLSTASEARGRGVARSLIEGVYDAADRAGVPNVYWLTAEDNYPGRMLYDRVGQRSPFIRYNRKL